MASTSNQNENNNQNQDQNEFEIPAPHRKNDDITTTEPGKNYRGEQVQKEEDTTTQNQGTDGEGTQQQRTNDSDDKRTENKVGFETEGQKNDGGQKRLDNDKEREEREDTTNPKYKDADWQQDKMNEANNEKGKGVQGVDVDEKGKPRNEKLNVNKEANVSDKGKEKGSLSDTRNDSIVDRPRTETYENGKKNDASKAINEGNYQHTREEEKRQKENKVTGDAGRTVSPASSKENTPQR